MKYRSEIDGLRAVAVIPVVLFHAGFQNFSGGYVGVDVFFVISGYLITSIILSELSQNKFTIANFYERRARRILPALFFMMAFCIPLAILLFVPSDLKSFGQSLISVSTFTSNFFFWQESGYFATASEFKPLLHTWSLAVEEQYYILFPVFMMLVWRFGIKVITILLSIIFIISFCLMLSYIDRYPSAVFFLLPTRGWELLIGVFASFYLAKFSYPKSRIINEISGILGLILIFFAIIFFDENTPFPSFYTLIPTFGTLLIILSAKEGTLTQRFLSNKIFVTTGLISYSAYLYHQPLFAFVRYKYEHDLSTLVLICLCISAFLMGYFSWRFIEKPFRTKTMTSRKFIFNFSFIGLIAFASFGLWLNKTDGMLKDYSAIEKDIYRDFSLSSKYVEKQMKSKILHDFPSEASNKILIIGDSFAEDLVNVVYESNLREKLAISTYRIPAPCGVLYIDQKDIKEYQTINCDNRPNFFNEPLLEDLIVRADEIWIASSWKDWHIKFLPRSLDKIKELNKKIKVFGTKAFSISSARNFKKLGGITYIQKDFDVSKEIVSVNDEIEQITESLDLDFINSMEIICGSKSTCKNSHDGEGIISYDGRHLTKYGATYFGENLSRYLNYD